MPLCSSSGEERCCESAASPGAWGINSIAIAGGGTGNVEQDKLPPCPHPLGARSAVTSRLLWFALPVSAEMSNWKLMLVCALQEPKRKMRIAACWLFCL